MAHAFMVTNRWLVDGDLGSTPDVRNLRFYVSDQRRDALSDLQQWTVSTRDDFIARLQAAAA